MTSIKPRRQVNEIFTLRDAEQERHRQDYEIERRVKVRELRAKVKRWEKKVQEFGGEIHKETLARFQKELADLL